jgi:geranylgeranyl reductase family protein
MSNKPNQYDIAVIGGGPAGATAAYLMAVEGLNVCLVDKQTFPRDKLCGGLLTWKTINLVSNIFNAPLTTLGTEGVIIHACRNYRIYHQGRRIKQGTLDFPFHFTERHQYDRFWLEKARLAGAKIRTSTAVRAVAPDTGMVKLENGETLKAKILIGADGVWSLCRRTILGIHGRHHPWRRNLAMTIEMRQPMNASSMSGCFASLYFGFLPWGYGWDFPVPGHRIVGVAAHADKSRGMLKIGFDRLRNTLGLPGMQDPDSIRSHPLPYGNWVDPPGSHRLLLIGDACGLADPLLGEGIYYAHLSARLAALAVRKSHDRGHHLQQIYRDLLNRYIFKEFRWIKFYRSLLFTGGMHRRFRGLKLLMALFPKAMENAIQSHPPLFPPLPPTNHRMLNTEY